MRRGFTMIELFFGLIITSLVMGAVGAFALATGQAWERADQLESLTLRARRAGVRVADAVRNAKLIAACNAGSIDGSAAVGAAILIWTGDTNGDGEIQGAELALIEHDPAAHQLLLYPAGLGDALSPLPWSIVNDPEAVEDFKRGRTGVPLARGVYGALFSASHLASATQCPTLEFSLRLRHEKLNSLGQRSPIGSAYTEYGTCVVRAPLPVPS